MWGREGYRLPWVTPVPIQALYVINLIKGLKKMRCFIFFPSRIVDSQMWYWELKLPVPHHISVSLQTVKKMREGLGMIEAVSRWLWVCYCSYLARTETQKIKLHKIPHTLILPYVASKLLFRPSMTDTVLGSRNTKEKKKQLLSLRSSLFNCDAI